MACDGDIDKREVKLIKQLQKENKTFGEIDINSELDTMLLAINKDGQEFLKGYFNELTTTELTEANELKLIEVAIDTIKADDKVEYSEIKFFKVIRSKLKINNEPILEKHPDFEDYLEQDIITDSYLSRLQNDFFDTHISNEFELISEIDNDILDNLKEDNEK
ncbi:hypothetical protein GCM10010832_26130 [Psychroflexus planctonicus]|uniref:TerB family tellurite resistance protein n=2 Tax=Psychroflexus planctonicus TaxID=1526575 RepID=A0ABQ1SPI5_9FLAO|nr:hypothetical protein GCM10010832_26130 [Psychroflexus planctonicus]